jgi:hypothetical protein
MRGPWLEPREVPTLWVVNTISGDPTIGNAATRTGSLPWCVNQADNDADTSEDIGFQKMIGGNIDLSAALDVTKDMCFHGNNSITVDRAAGATGNFSLLFVSQQVSCTVDYLAFTGGVSAEGGGIFNKGGLTLNYCTLRDNSASTYGGGIFSDIGSTTTLDGCVVSYNFDSAGQRANLLGGGIYNAGTMEISYSDINNNVAARGGGICNAGTLSIFDNTQVWNNLANSGGGIEQDNNPAGGGTLTVSAISIHDNSADGASGGGIEVQSGTATFTNVTFGTNHADSDHGGAFYITGGASATFNTCTFQGNTAMTDSGGTWVGTATATDNGCTNWDAGGQTMEHING